MAFRAGTVSWFALDTAAGALTSLQPYLDNVTVPNSTEMLDVSVFGTQAKGFIPGLTNGDTINISGPYDVAAYTHLTNALGSSNAGATLTFMWGPGGSVAGQAKVQGECYIASLELPSTVGGRVEFSATLQVTGAVTLGTF